ncbi:MAG: aminotransferase class III-fold pyridoxal phosphate-dependent enzyme, partial [Desulfonatronovibrionaceae bacterium]
MKAKAVMPAIDPEILWEMNMDASLSLEERTAQSICHTYARYPLAVKKARGSILYDFHGRQFVDLLAGIAVCGLGHSHPEIIQAIQDQTEKLIHVSNLFYQEEQVLLAEKLLSLAPLDKVFFCNSGAEANEAAIKLVRRYMSHIKKQNRFEILTLSGSFHGRTMASMAATG